MHSPDYWAIIERPTLMSCEKGIWQQLTIASPVVLFAWRPHSRCRLGGD